jgi:hypothetical protein
MQYYGRFQAECAETVACFGFERKGLEHYWTGNSHLFDYFPQLPHSFHQGHEPGELISPSRKSLIAQWGRK